MSWFKRFTELKEKKREIDNLYQLLKDTYDFFDVDNRWSHIDAYPLVQRIKEALPKCTKCKYILTNDDTSLHTCNGCLSEKCL